MKGLHFVKTKIEEKEKKGVGVDFIRIDIEVKDKMADIEKLLNKMNEVIRTQQRDKKT